MPAMDVAIEAHAGLAQDLQQPLNLCLNIQFQAMRALLAGRFADSERLAQEALAIGQRLQTENVAGIFGLQMFTLRREQGRLQELESAVRYFVQQHTAAAAWRPGLALIYSELGRTAGGADGVRAPGAARLCRSSPRRPMDGLHDVSHRRLHLPGRYGPGCHLVPSVAALRRTRCGYWQCRGLLRCCVTLPGDVSRLPWSTGTTRRSISKTPWP